MVGLCLGTVFWVALSAILLTQRAVQPVAEQRHLEQLRLQANIVTDQVEHMRTEVLILREIAPAAALVRAAERGEPLPQGELTRTATLFKTYLDHHPQYLQARLIGVAHGGREIVRVERSMAGETPQVVPSSRLQQKGERGYVRDALPLRDDEVHISDVELNREWGEIQLPAVPVIRAAAPVFDGQRALGVVVINVDLRNAFNQLRTHPDNSPPTYLVDSKGNFLVHPERGHEFQQEFGHPNLLNREFPELEPQLRGDHAISTTQGSDISAVPVQLAQGPRLWLFSPLGQLAESASAAAVQGTIAVAIVAVLLALLLARGMSEHIVKPLRALTQAAQRYPEPTGFVAEGPEEVRILGRALQRMADDVASRTAALSSQEQRYRRLFEASPTALLQVDANQHIMLVSRSAETLFGYSREELIGQPVAQLVPTEVSARHEEDVARFLEAPEARVMGRGRDLVAVRRDGTTVPVEVGLTPMETAEGLRVLVSVVDITERKRFETEIRRSNAQLEQFAYIASHDLQEPLRMVASYTELFARKYRGQLDEQADKYIGFATEGARRLKELVSALLDYSRVDSRGKPLSAVSAQEVAEQVVHSLEALCEDTGGEVAIESELPQVMADAAQLAQVLQNLISNGLKFHGETPPRVGIAARIESGMVHFTVRDNGIGLDPKYSDRIFDMFQRLHDRGAYEGSGMGLAIAKGIVDRHGGKIWVESEPGKGSTFHFTLQRAGG